MRFTLPVRWGGFLAALVVAAPAFANGRYPASGQIIVHPADTGTVLVRATYGLLLTHDAGKSWGWICERAVGYSGVEDPAMGFMQGGTLLAGIFEGLSEGTPDGCAWSFAPVLANTYVIDVAVDKVDPSRGVVLISNGVGTDDAGSPTFSTQVWQTSDVGVTWTQAGVSLDAEALGLTVDTAPSNPMRVYVSGRAGPPSYSGVLERSDDRGATWQELPIPGTDDMHLPYIGAVDPNDPDVVYVRIDSGSSDWLTVTKDGGMTWSTVFTASGTLNGFALSPDGSTVAVGTPGLPQANGPNLSPGIWTAPSSTLQFTQRSTLGALCLTWAPSGLYACADELTDHFTAGLSTDGGETFQPILHLGGICPLTCTEPDSGVTRQCPASWLQTAETIGATCDLDLGGSGGGGSAGAGGQGAGASSGGGGAHASSCRCSLPDRAESGLAGLASLALAGARLRRRRRSGERA